MITLTLYGFDSAKIATEEAHKSLKKELKRELDRYAEKIMTIAKMNAPVLTGQLRASINIIDIDELSRWIGSNQTHAAAQEFGTSAPHPIEKRAVGKELKKFVEKKGAQKYPGQTVEQSLFLLTRYIKKEGIKAHPYLMPAFKLGRDAFALKCQDIAKNFGANV